MTLWTSMTSFASNLTMAWATSGPGFWGATAGGLVIAFPVLPTIVCLMQEQNPRVEPVLPKISPRENTAALSNAT
jgi:hypothetical protein